MFSLVNKARTCVICKRDKQMIMKKMNRTSKELEYVRQIAGAFNSINYNGHNISVFTTQGQYVTSFGQKGEGKGDFNSPWGVCVDRDGFVYVCDDFNDRVQVF